MMISFDAVSDADLEFLAGLPNFAALCKSGTLVRDVESVFISNTYPTHASIITGVYPAKHGIIENLLPDAGTPHPAWRYDSRLYKVPTLFDKVAQADMTACTILYPVTGSANIRWNFPEIAGAMSPLRRLAKMLRKGSPSFVFSALLRNRFQKAAIRQKGIAQPNLDNFSTDTAVWALRNYRPNLLALHLLDADDQKHHYGPASREAQDALLRLDERLGILLSAFREAFPAGEAAVIVFSDHACLSVHTAINLNDSLREFGLEQSVAFAHNAGGTAFLKILKQAKNEDILFILNKLTKQPFVRRLLTPAEMEQSGLNTEFSYGLEAADGYYFGAAGYKGQHGYSLKQDGYRCFYLASGPGIPQGAVKKGGAIVDICPLSADLLGLPGWEMDGTNKVMEA